MYLMTMIKVSGDFENLQLSLFPMVLFPQNDVYNLDITFDIKTQKMDSIFFQNKVFEISIN